MHLDAMFSLLRGERWYQIPPVRTNGRHGKGQRLACRGRRGMNPTVQPRVVHHDRECKRHLRQVHDGHLRNDTVSTRVFISESARYAAHGLVGPNDSKLIYTKERP